MGTRSSITIYEESVNGKGIYTGVYCHWDGYLSHNGEILISQYNTANKVAELISLGDMSSLGETPFPDPNKPHTFDKSQEGVCVYYHRDRGENWETTKPRISDNEAEFYNSLKQEYNYLFRDGEWYWNDWSEENWKGGKPVWKLLTREDIERDC